MGGLGPRTDAPTLRGWGPCQLRSEPRYLRQGGVPTGNPVTAETRPKEAEWAVRAGWIGSHSSLAVR